jgi:amino acid permease
VSLGTSFFNNRSQALHSDSNVDNSQMVNHGRTLEEGGEAEKHKADAPMLQPKMKPRHLNMIAVGGSIGTGLFVGSGSALNAGGPAGVLIAWILIGMMLINVTQVSVYPAHRP